MNSLLLISPDRALGFKPILSGKRFRRIKSDRQKYARCSYPSRNRPFRSIQRRLVFAYSIFIRIYRTFENLTDNSVPVANQSIEFVLNIFQPAQFTCPLTIR
ncbi:hypothetical protein QUA35_30470 [Microcoleus sp. N9_B2]